MKKQLKSHCTNLQVFLQFLKQISINDRIKLYSFSLRFKPFQVLSILSIFNIKIVINNKGILANEISFGKVLIFLLFSYLSIHRR